LFANLFVFAFSLASSYSSPSNIANDTISFNFERKIIQKGSTETVKGIVYYKAPHRVFIDVNSPIKQVMVVDESKLTIYYPSDKKAFIIKSRGLIPMPFIQSIISVMKDDYGLAEVGYSLIKHEKKDNRIYTYWNPPKEHKKHIGEFILATENDLLVYAEAKYPNSKSAAKSFYSKHIDLNGKHFPLEIHTEIQEVSRKTDEYVTYSDVKLNIVLPKQAMDFKLPANTEVKEVSW